MKARRLIKLDLQEVSVCDRGSSPGAEVRFMKGARTMMPTALEYAELTVKGANEGRIGQTSVNTVMKALAQDLAGGNMAKFLETDVGKVFLRPRQRNSTAVEYDLQREQGYAEVDPAAYAKRNAPTDWNDPASATLAYRAEKLAKSRTNPTTTARYYQATPSQNGDGMDQIDWSDDKQATAAYRREQAAKAKAGYQGSHEDENTGRRSVTGDRLNPKAVSP
jgi:hypothetical protein